MRHSDFRKSPVYRALLLILLTGLTISASALDLTLNGRNHAVMNLSALGAHSRNGQIPLQTLYPWLESVEYLEVQSGVNRVYWDASRLGEAQWNGARLIFRSGVWEVHVGRDIFSDPDRIAVRGVRKDVDSVTIWSTVDIPGYKTDLLSAFALRSVRVNWQDISRISYRLDYTSPEELPHLIILDQLDLVPLEEVLGSYQPVSTGISQWYEGDSTGPLALDAYHPEAALLYLMAENDELFDSDGNLPAGLSELFDWIASSGDTDIRNTETAMADLDAGIAGSAVRLPFSAEAEYRDSDMVSEMSPPNGAVNIVRYRYAAIPGSLEPENEEIAELVLADAFRSARLKNIGPALPIPLDDRVIRYYDAYERIGRLGVSDQMDGVRAADLINDYINGTEEMGEAEDQ